MKKRRHERDRARQEELQKHMDDVIAQQRDDLQLRIFLRVAGAVLFLLALWLAVVMFGDVRDAVAGGGDESALEFYGELLFLCAFAGYTAYLGIDMMMHAHHEGRRAARRAERLREASAPAGDESGGGA